MNKYNNLLMKKIQSPKAIIIAIILVLFGAVMIMFTLNDYRASVKANFDDGLWDAEIAVDYQLTNSFNRFKVDLEYSATRQGFIHAEEVWLNTGSDSQLVERMRSSSIANRPQFKSFLAIRDGKVEISSDDDKEYVIGDEIAKGIKAAKGSNGEDYLAFAYDAGDGIEYVVLYDLKNTYVSLVERLTGENNELRLVDSSGEITLQIRNDKKVNKAIKGQAKSGNDMVMAYKNKDKDDFRMVIRPVQNTDNGVFSIAVASNYAEIESMVNRVTTKLFFFMAIIAIGLLMIILLVIRSRQRIAEADQELKELKEKNAAMEELNKKTQELAHHQRLETIGTLTSSIAHEFNNLLTPIMGYSMMTLESLPDDSEIYDDILEIYNASCKAKDIISRLSELSRKNTEVVFEPLSPNVLVNKVMKVAAPALPKNVDINRNLNVPGYRVFGNDVQLSQMLLNLIINAFQSTEIEGGEITLSTIDEGNEILFILEDQGQGIPEEIMDQIFEPFFTTKETGKGTGLGLAIVAQAVEDHNGRIEVQSKPGEGTRFTIHIPAYEHKKDEDSVMDLED